MPWHSFSMPNIEDEIRSKVSAFATDLAALVRRSALEAVAATLAGTAMPAKAVKVARAAAPAPVAVKRGRGRPKKAVAAPAAKAPAAKATKAAPAVKAAGSKKPAAVKRPPGAKRPPAELARLVDRLGDYIKANPGKRMEVIAKALDLPTRELNLPVKKLIAAKRVRSQGEKRATEYFAA